MNKCNGCKKNLEKSEFKVEEKVFARCNTCRENDIKKYKKKGCIECGIRASYNYKGQKDKIYCKEHSLARMIDLNQPRCEFDDCIKSPNFNYEGDKRRRFCVEHKLEGMINVSNKCCEYQNCKKEPHFNFENEEKPRFCYKHKEDDMINIISKKCKLQECNTTPRFNFGGKSPLYCEKHKEEGMINVTIPICQFTDCSKPAYYNLKGLKPKYCSQHKEAGMIYLIFKNKCLECNKQASFNFKGENKGLYCSQHKKEEMINISIKTCESENCDKNPTYGYKEEGKRRYCVKHKKDDMVIVKNIYCKFEGCLKTASCNFQDEIKAIYCKDHKQDGMICILGKKCEKCNKRASYGFKNEKAKFCADHKEKGMSDLVKKSCEKCERGAAFNFQDSDSPLFCSIHKEEGMINLKNKFQRCEKCSKYAIYNLEGQKRARFCLEHKEDNMINVKDKRCDQCNSIANFGFCAQLPLKCAKHKLDKMYFKPRRVCIGNDEEDCKELAIYGITEPKHCEDHSTDKEVCLLGKKCNGCFREDLILNRNGLCILFCEPDEIYKKIEREKIKEKTILNYLDQNINTKNIIKIIDDKTLNHFCNKYRPDRVYDCGTHYVIVEVDENQHKNYHQMCSKGEKVELIRMHEIQNAAGIHCIFLRFNPDDFKVNNEKKKINMAQRLKILKKWVEYCFNKIPKTDLLPVQVKYLFYDNYEEDNLDFFIIDDILVYRTTI